MFLNPRVNNSTLPLYLCREENRTRGLEEQHAKRLVTSATYFVALTSYIYGESGISQIFHLASLPTELWAKTTSKSMSSLGVTDLQQMIKIWASFSLLITRISRRHHSCFFYKPCNYELLSSNLLIWRWPLSWQSWHGLDNSFGH